MPTLKAKRTWLVFGACAAAMIAALGWTTATLLRLEAGEWEARRQADLQERIRVALWRMDSLIAPRLTEEAARPYFHYAAFYAPARAYSRMLLPIDAGEILVPSPLLRLADPFFILHFQVDASGKVTSPQAPEGNLRDLAETSYLSSTDVAAAAELLASFTKAAPPAIAPGAEGAAQLPARSQTSSDATSEGIAQHGKSGGDQLAQSAREWGSRQRAVLVAQHRAVIQNTMNQASENADPRVEVGLFEPVWHRGPVERDDTMLLFVRHVSVGGAALTQGIWADWPAIRKSMLRAVRDLLPGADLVPTRTPWGPPPEEGEPGRLLASMPAVLAPGPLPEAGSPSLTPLRATLAVSWVLVLAAIGTVAVVLRAAMDLSRRRGKFVSAVTHELRTPLTTFRMYSDMLVEGMVLGEQARREYLATLRDESDHLSRLVENVLTYARIEQGRELPARRDRLTVDELIARATVRPAERARRAGAKLSIDLRNADAEPSPDLAPGVASVVVATDVGAVEQIVGNLIDNAVRYAVPVDSRVDILISLDSPAVNRKAVPGMLCICVADHGPGVEAKDADRIFRPFVRGPGGVRAGQNTVVQGVGLGLAISRQLARHLGGDLKLCGPDGRGARFVLLLPIAR